MDKAMRILAEIGVRIPNDRMLEVLAGFGATIDRKAQMVFIPPARIQNLLDTSAKFALAPDSPILIFAGAYPQYYMPPGARKAQPHTLDSVATMTRLVDELQNVHIVYDGMGVPSDVPAILQPLYMRLLVWKHTRKGGCGQIQVTDLCPYAVEMGQVMVDSRGGKLSDHAFLNIELISPLQLGKEEATQFVYFWERGLPAYVGSILSAGGTAPATLAGTLALQLAENLLVNCLNRAFYDQRALHITNSTTVLDMKRAVFQYGRPELGLTHLAMGQIARHCGATFGANSFLGDAKFPSCEMGMQKAINAIPAILAGTVSLGNVGLLSVDEIGSPLQLIIDNEYAGALQRFGRGFEIDEETLAFDLIRETGPGGFFTGTEHTALHYRREHWQPAFFSSEMYNSWIAKNNKIDIEHATDRFHDLTKSQKEPYLGEDAERALREIIARAERELV
jgi:trimethylamine--corrinoid protein Co-methyltransferase